MTTAAPSPRHARPASRRTSSRRLGRSDTSESPSPAAEPLRSPNPPPRPPGTDADVRTKTVKALGWTASSRVLIQVLQFVVTAVLARLLSPEDFGLMAIAVVFNGFAYVLADLGVGQAVVWVADASERLKATAFWINAISGVVISGILEACSPLIASAFGDDRVQPLVAVVGLSFAVSLFVVHAAMLQRTMQFGRIVRVEVVGVLAYSAISVGLALAGLGAMSLAIGSLSQSGVMTISYWLVVRWRPHHWIDRESAGVIRRYSAGIFGSSVLGYWTRNVDNLLIGRFTTVTTLGFYSRAYNLMLLPISQVTFAVGRVLFPAFTQVKHDIDRLRSAYLRVITVVAALVVPLAVGLACAAPAFVRTVYGPRWADVAPLLTVLALSAPAQVIGTLNGPVYQALGRTGSQFRRSIIGFLATLTAVVIGLQWGAIGVCVGLLLRYYLLIPNSISGIWPAMGMRAGLLIRRVWGIVVCAAISAAAMVALRLAPIEWPAWLELLCQAAAGAAVYLCSLSLIAPSVLRLVRRMGRAETRPVSPSAPAPATAAPMAVPGETSEAGQLNLRP